MSPIDHLLRWLGLDFDFDLADAPFDQITPHLWLGSRPTPERVAAMERAGITHVVSCLPESERAAVAFLDGTFHTHFIPIVDGMEQDIRAAIPPFFDALSEVIPAGRMLVHCEVGVSRSASLAIAHVMQSTNSRFYEAFCEVRRRRPQVLPNIGFASQLQHFEFTLHPRRPYGELASLSRYLDLVCNVPVEATVLQAALEAHEFDAVQALRSIFGGEIPRVVQGVR